MSTSFLPYGRHSIDEDDVEAVAQVMRGSFLTTGPMVDAFEVEIARKTGARFASVCSNGTAALHLGAMAIGIKPGDTVVVPAMTFVATANAARYCGASVVFCDVDPDTGLMRTEDLERTIEEVDGPIAAAFPVHLAGQLVDMEALSVIASASGIKLMEDASHAIGTMVRLRDDTQDAAGSSRFSDITTFSFHPVKTIAMGEGGVVTTNNADLADRLSELRAHGITRDPLKFENRDLAFANDGALNPWYYEASSLGYNYRASDIHCALGLSQLAKLDRFVGKRRQLVARYDELLADMAPAVRVLARAERQAPAWHLNVVLIDFDALKRERSVVMNEMRARGIGTQVHYIPVPWHPLYSPDATGRTFEGAASFYRRCLSLPLFPDMTIEDVERTVAALRSALF